MGNTVPTSRLVAVHWLKGIAALNNRVATKLPTDYTTWSASGFVTVGLAGGTPDAYLPIDSPVISVHCWGFSTDMSNPPWGLAADLAQSIRNDQYGVLDHRNVARNLIITPTARYKTASVRNARMLTHPDEVPNDPGDYAHFVFDLHLDWIAV